MSQDSTQENLSWRKLVKEYKHPTISKSLWQIVNSIGGYALLWALIYFALPISLWLTVPLVVLAGGMLVRVFIIFHDCTHGSFFSTRKANVTWGYITGILAFTPYHQWKWEHTTHHAHAGDLDSRGMGDVSTMTVDEYLAASPGKRLIYRIKRNPFVLFVIAPITLFLVLQRFPTRGGSAKTRWSVYLTNLGLLVMAGLMSLVFGWQTFVVLQFAILFVASSAGVWLFYIQHQFEGVSWERNENWDFTQAALEGSSFYRLPKILQWFSGNIGFHHIHHLSPHIPNYNLEDCHNSAELFQAVPEVTLKSSLKSFSFRLWDEENRQLVGFDHLKTIRDGEVGAR